jgi:hypothetical protein
MQKNSALPMFWKWNQLFNFLGLAETAVVQSSGESFSA